MTCVVMRYVNSTNYVSFLYEKTIVHIRLNTVYKMSQFDQIYASGFTVQRVKLMNKSEKIYALL